MTEKTAYEFGAFRLDPVRRTLLLREESRSLTPTGFDLLVVFVQNHGQTLSKAELIKRVWGDTVVTNNNFNVTLTAVRRALDESAKQPRYILRVPNGYRFVADVREIRTEASGLDALVATANQANLEDRRDSTQALPLRVSLPPNAHLSHMFVSCSLLAALYAVSVFLEISYEFERFGSMAWKTAPFVFGWIVLSSILGLTIDRRLTRQGRANGLMVSTAIFFIAAGVLFVVLTRFLPSFPVTQSTLQSYPTQAAYLKDTSYFLVLALCFLIVPFHFIVSMEREVEQGRLAQVWGLLASNQLSTAPRGAIYPRFWALAALLVVLAGFSLVMTSRLLDHLKPGNHMNLFTQLVYVRGILYFGLGIESLVWYYLALERLRRSSHDGASFA